MRLRTRLHSDQAQTQTRRNASRTRYCFVAAIKSIITLATIARKKISVRAGPFISLSAARVSTEAIAGASSCATASCRRLNIQSNFCNIFSPMRVGGHP